MKDSITLPTTKYQRIMQILSFLFLIGQLLCILYYWPKLPELVPSHFNFSGTADAWQDKSTIFVVPVISLLLYPFLTIIEKLPEIWNVPGPVTQENRLWIYSNIKNMLLTMKCIIMLIFFYMTLRTCQCQNMGAWFTPFTLISLGACMFFFLKRSQKPRS